MSDHIFEEDKTKDEALEKSLSSDAESENIEDIEDEGNIEDETDDTSDGDSDEEGTYPYSMGDLDENHIEFYRDSDTATVYFTKRKYINRIEKLKKEHPDEVVIQNETKSDTLAKVPLSWIRVMPPRQVNLTDEQREELRVRLKQMREKQKKKGEKNQ